MPPRPSTNEPMDHASLLTGFLGLVAVVMFALWFSQPPWIIVVLVLLALIVFGYFRSGVTSPLLWYELIRLSRDSRYILLRCGYVVALLLVLWFTYRNWYFNHLTTSVYSLEEERNQMGRLGEDFTYNILILQNAAVIVLAPFMVAGAVVEERRRGSLDMLFLSHLQDREIVVGKLLVRVVSLGMILLGGLPVLAIIYIGGAVNLYLVVAGFVTAVATMVHIAAVGLFLSTVCRTYWNVIGYLLSYTLFLFPILCCIPFIGGLANPFTFMIELDNAIRQGSTSMIWMPIPLGPLELTLTMCAQYVVFHGLFIVVYLMWATRWLRFDPTTRKEMDRIYYRIEEPWMATRHQGPILWIPRLTPALPMRVNPLMWKERRETKGVVFSILMFHWLLMFGMAMLGVSLLSAYANGDFNSGHRLSVALEEYNGALRVTGVLFLGMILVAECLRAASSVVRERERRTMESLLTIPTERSTILWIKGLLGVWQGRWNWLGLVVFWTASCTFGALHPGALVLSVAHVVALLIFVTGLGIFVSMLCQTVVQANLTAMCVLVGLMVASYMLPGELAWWRPALNPLEGWYCLAYSWEEFRQAQPSDVQQRLAAMVGLMGYGVIGTGLWGWSHRRFGMDPLK